MRTKLLFAFLLVISVAFVSNLVFEKLVMNDFDEYIKGTREDQLYWVLASIEGSYQGSKWNMRSLSESIHWGIMLGFDTKVEDKDGNEITSSVSVMNSLSDEMKRRMQSHVQETLPESEYEKYPLYMEGKEFGTLYVRRYKSEGPVIRKGAIFKKRGEEFLVITFLIAGICAVSVAVFLSLYLSRPLRRLKLAAESVAKGDFSVRVRVSSRDEIGKLSVSFNYMAEALQKEEILRNHLMANIAHELRTPLAVMRAHIEAMIDSVVEDIPEGLKNVGTEVERLTRLVEGIEDIAKAEASFFSKGEARTGNLREFLSGIEYSMAPIIRDKGLGFSLIDRGDIYAAFDPDKLDRVIKNILSNSLKFTDEGEITVDYGRDAENFFIEITDTGRGIPEEETDRIFARFYRVEGVKSEGIGVGLAIVKELVDAMGGRIEVRSKVGKGTTFKIWLPVRA